MSETQRKETHMKELIFLNLILFSLGAFADFGNQAKPEQSQRGTSIFGPTTPLNKPAYPNSGSTKSRSKDITGEDTATATGASSDVDPTVPTKNPRSRKPVSKQAQDEEIKIKEGPYEDGKYQFNRSNNKKKEN